MTDRDSLDDMEPALRQQLDRLMPEPSAGYNDWLRSRLEAERSAMRTRPLRARSWRLAAGIAAAAALLVVAPGLISRIISPPCVVWAEVKRAMEGLRHFTASVIEQEGDRLKHIEAYYSAPESWRIHYVSDDRQNVIFVSPRGSGAYDAVEKTWFSRSQGPDLSLPPGEFTGVLEKEGLLTALLAFFFRDGAPQGEPVRNAAESASGELEVFDFATAPGKTWARVWVLPKSRLPIRAQVYRPEAGEVTSVSFDYSDPQPEAFFDIRSFEEAAASPRVDKAHEAFRIGKEPLAGKPRSPDQVFQVKGIVAPKILEVVANRRGDILLKTDNPENVGVEGGRLSSLYWDEATDNWGNLYVRITGDRHSGGEAGNPVIFQYYSPVSPRKSGAGRQVLTLPYTAWSHNAGDKSVMGFDKILHVEKIEIPAPTVDGAPSGWPDVEGLEERDLAAAGHYEHAPALESLRALDSLLEKQPGSRRLQETKLRVLEDLDREEAQSFFEENLMEGARKRPAESCNLSRFLCARAMMLDRSGRTEEFEGWVREIQASLERELGSMRPDRAEWWRDFLSEHPLSGLLAMPRTAREIQESSQAAILETVLTSDGYLLVAIETPFAEAAEGKGSSARRFLDSTPDDAPWRQVATFHEDPDASRASGKARRLVVLRGRGREATILLSTPVNPRSRHSVSPSVTVRLDVDVPGPSPETIDGYLSRHQELVIRWPPKGEAAPHEDARTAAVLLERLERFSEALGGYRVALELHVKLEEEERATETVRGAEGKTESDTDLQGEGGRRDEPGKDPARTARSQGWRTEVLLAIARCLRKLDRLEEAIEELRKAEAAAPRMPAGMYAHDLDFGKLIVAERMAVARRHIEIGKPDAARRLVEEESARRPDHRTLSTLNEPFERGFSGHSESTKERHRAYLRFLPVDRVMHRLGSR